MFTFSGMKMEAFPVKVSLGGVLLWGTVGDLRTVAVVCLL